MGRPLNKKAWKKNEINNGNGWAAKEISEGTDLTKITETTLYVAEKVEEIIRNNKTYIKVVDNIAARNALVNVFEGMRVHCIDATADTTVIGQWAEYLYTGSEWVKTSEKESIDVILDAGNVSIDDRTVQGYNATNQDELNSEIISKKADLSSSNFNGSLKKYNEEIGIVKLYENAGIREYTKFAEISLINNNSVSIRGRLLIRDPAVIFKPLDAFINFNFAINTNVFSNYLEGFYFGSSNATTYLGDFFWNYDNTLKKVYLYYLPHSTYKIPQLSIDSSNNTSEDIMMTYMNIGTGSVDAPTTLDQSGTFNYLNYKKILLNSEISNEVIAADSKIPTGGAVYSAISNAITGHLKYKGYVDSFTSLPSVNLTIGDVYNVVLAYGNYPAGSNFAWNGSSWNALGGSVDLSNYVTNSNLNTNLSNYVTTTNLSNNTASIVTQGDSKITTGNAVYNAISSAVAGIYKYKGSIAAYSSLPSASLTAGDVYNVIAAYGNYPAGTNYAWNGSAWDALGGSVDLSNYVTSTNLATTLNNYVNTTSTQSIAGIKTYNNVITLASHLYSAYDSEFAIIANNPTETIFGSPHLATRIRSQNNPKVTVGANNYSMYHTGNKPTADDVGAMKLVNGTSGNTYFQYDSSTKTLQLKFI